MTILLSIAGATVNSMNDNTAWRGDFEEFMEGVMPS